MEEVEGDGVGRSAGCEEGSWRAAQPKYTPESAFSIQSTPSTGIFAVGIPSYEKRLVYNLR